MIELNGIDTTSGVNGIQIRTSNSIVRGFAVRNFADEGIEADGSASYGGDNNLIENNWVGLDGTGAADGVAEHGIMLSVNADNNIVRNNVVVDSGYSGLIINDNSNNNNDTNVTRMVLGRFRGKVRGHGFVLPWHPFRPLQLEQ